MERLGKLFTGLDMYGHKIGVNYEGSDHFRTKLGAVVTLITYVLILINALNIGTQFVNDDNQKEIYRPLQIDLNTFPMQNMEES